MFRPAVTLVFATLLAACGGGGGGGETPPPPAQVRVTVTPAQTELAPAATQQFACAVTGSTDTRCSWRVETAAGGSVTAAGLYSAPSTTGTYRVVAASVADPAQSATATVVVRATTPAATPWVTGYYVGYYWDVMYPPQAVDMTAMTHLVFGRVAPGSGTLGGTPGQIMPGAGTAHQPRLSPDGLRSVEDYLIVRAHAAGTKALLMIGGVGDGNGFLRSTTDAVRPTFVRNLVDYMVLHDYDGVDLDWEDELDGSPALGVSAAEARRRLMALISDIRVEAAGRSRYRDLGSRVLITFPGYAKNINFLEPGGRVQQWEADVANMVDQYNLMSYGNAYLADGWLSWLTGPIFGATGNTPYDLDSSIRAYVATGVPRSKLGIGIGFYGIYYGPTITGPRQSISGNNILNNDDNALGYSELYRKGYLSRGTYRYDAVARVGYRSYAAPGYVPANDPNSSPAGFLSYENEDSIRAKGAWVRETGVGGTIIWTINYGYLPDSRTNPLLDAVKQSFLR